MRRIGMIWAVSMTMAGCGGIREGSEVTIRHHPSAYKEPSEAGRTRVVDVTPGYHRREGRARVVAVHLDTERYMRVAAKEAVSLDGGTPVRVLKVEGDMAQVAVLAGEHSGLALWVARDDLERK
jgi:hypothetical protein